MSMRRLRLQRLGALHGVAVQGLLQALGLRHVEVGPDSCDKRGKRGQATVPYHHSLAGAGHLLKKPGLW